MKKKYIFMIIGLVLSIILFFVIKNMTLSIEEKVEKKMNKMNLEEKIAQMLIIYYQSIEYDETIENVIKTYNPGGFILFDNNIENYEGLNSFIKSMKKDAKIPMFISIDEEGGRVQRLDNLKDIEVTRVPAMEKVGLTNDEELAYEIGKITGKKLNIFGINMDYAPVLDINSNPNNEAIGDRCFGNNAEIVSKMALAFGKGLRYEGIIPVYKHFPGHGDTNTDPHEELPILNKTKEELYNLELKPFIEAINNNVEVIMIGHFNVPSLSKDPSSLSKEVITDLLKEELGYKGLVITDALNMEALTDNYGEEEVLIKAINAGVDILLMPGTTKDTIMTIKGSIRDGKIKEKQIDKSVKKILTLKYKYGLFKSKKNYDKEELNSEENLKIIEKVLD